MVPGEALHRDRADRAGSDPANWFRFGASPALPAPDTLLQAGRSEGTGIWVEWNGATGFGYVLEASPDPSLGLWDPIESFTQEGVIQFEDPDASIFPSRFYRLRIVE